MTYFSAAYLSRTTPEAVKKLLEYVQMTTDAQKIYEALNNAIQDGRTESMLEQIFKLISIGEFEAVRHCLQRLPTFNEQDSNHRQLDTELHNLSRMTHTEYINQGNESNAQIFVK